MAETVTFTGMILTASPMKEFDKRVEVLTKERGRISAFARGARRLTAPFRRVRFLLHLENLPFMREEMLTIL